MTDNKIIKALECCINDHCTTSCPMYNTTDVRLECKYLIAKYALDLINRQKAEKETMQSYIDCLKAEIERLNRDYSTAVETMSNSIRTSRAEAIKEFAERLSEKAPHITEERFLILQNEIDNLVKEMVGADGGS